MWRPSALRFETSALDSMLIMLVLPVSPCGNVAIAEKKEVDVVLPDQLQDGGHHHNA